MDIIINFLILSFWCIVLIHLIPILWVRFIRPKSDWSKYKDKWAIVIGASEGLGEAFALSLAHRGLHIILVARTESKLKSVAQRISQETQRNTKIIIADVLQPDWIEVLSSSIRSLDISFLVNNAGGMLPGRFSRPFLEYSPEIIEKTHQLNTGYVHQSIRLVLPIMLRKRFGGILNIGSLSALGAAYLIPYSSDKAKLNSLTESLAFEYEGEGVIIQCASYGRVSTPSYQANVTNVASWDTPPPSKVVESTLNMFGAGGPNIIPYWVHDVQARMLLLIGLLRLPILKRIFKKLYQNQK